MVGFQTNSISGISDWSQVEIFKIVNMTAVAKIIIQIFVLYRLNIAAKLWFWIFVLNHTVASIVVEVMRSPFAEISISVNAYLIGITLLGIMSYRRHPDFNRPILLLHAITRLIVGGAQETVMYLTDLLDKERFQVEVLSGPQTGSEGSLIEEVRANGIPVTVLPDLLREISPLNDIMALFKMWRIIRNKGYTIVHTNSSKAGIIGRVAARLAGTPIIVHTIHGWSFHEHMNPWVRRMYVLLERFAASLTDAMVVVAKRDIDKGLNAGIGQPGKYHLIRSAIPIKEFDPQKVSSQTAREELGIPLDAPVLGNIGRFSSPKNPFDWIEVAALVAYQMPDCYFLLVGDGILREEAEALVSEKKLSERFVFTGLRRDVPEVLAAMDVFLLISLWEGLPRVIPQAMAMQKPVVATRVGGSEEVIVHGKTGYQCNYGDLEELAEDCVKLLRDDNLRSEMGQRGRDYAFCEFDVHKMANQMTALYDELLIRTQD